jgi:asparagine synthase (glutamine-hydrolysing)
MCGICGQFNFQSNAPVDPAMIQRMMDTIIHRGPDDSGMHLDGPLGLGFRRLAILDLSPAGHQPMSDPERMVWVVFNGEIYNFKEIRADLESKGHRFRSHCDTEVIVLGYKEWGAEILKRLNGMFGLAIWDVAKRRLIVARDPMGIKLVYFSVREDTLLFGSELRPILAALPARPGVDMVGLNLFLRYRYTPAPYTIHQGIRKLAPGEMLIVEKGTARVERWYTHTPRPFEPQPADDDAIEQLLDLYKRAIKRHLIADVPVGLLLSGGLDSGLLLALMAAHGSEWPTFTVGYGKSFKADEIDEAAQTAALYGAKHHTVRLDQGTFQENLPRIVRALEEPVASSSIVPMYFVCQRAREVVKVALVGQGPDELFGGYSRHLGVAYGALWRKLPAWLRSSVGTAIRGLPRNETLKRGIQSLAVENQLHRFQEVFSIQPDNLVDSLFRVGQLPGGAGDAVLDAWAPLVPQMEHLDELNAFHLLELRSSLPDELLMYGDKLSMAHALEVRVPYLDRELVEHVQSLGAPFKIRHCVRKWIHRKACRKFLPPTVINRPKRGFAVNVVDDWMRDSVRGKISDYLQDPHSCMYAHLDPAVVARLQSDHASGAQDNHKILFSLVVFEEWLRACGT